MKEIPITWAKDHLYELVSRLAYSGERVVLKRRGRPVAAMVSMGDLRRLSATEGAGKEGEILRAAGGWGGGDAWPERALAEVLQQRSQP